MMLAIVAGRALTRAHGSQTGHKVVGRKVRDLAAAASFGGISKLWRWQQALEAAGHHGLEAAGSSGSGSKLWRRQRALQEAVSSGGGSKLWRRQQALAGMHGLVERGDQMNSVEAERARWTRCQANFCTKNHLKIGAPIDLESLSFLKALECLQMAF